MSGGNFQFTWLKQRETLVSLSESLLKDGAYFDCQLCAEGHHFNVHRVILSCNSPVFSKILQEHNSDEPVITLEGISSIELGALVEFMYTGVTRIPPDYLKNFFQIAKSLQMAGLNHYDIAQIEKILNESDSSPTDTELQDSYEACSQNILKYLKESEASNDSEAKDLTTLNANDESIFLDEAVENSDIVSENSVIYEKYDSEFIKNSANVVESFEQPLTETDDLVQTCDAGNSNEIEESSNETPLMYDKYHNIFIKTETEKNFNDNITSVYSVSKVDDDLGANEENNFIELQDDLKITAEDENYVYVKLDNSMLNKVKEKVKECQLVRGKQNLSRNEIRFYTKKSLKVINAVDKNSVKKKSKIPNVVVKDTNTSADDKKIYICLKCGNKYSHKRTLLHHIHWICERPATYSCSLCPYRGKRKFQLKSHMKHAHLLKMS